MKLVFEVRSVRQDKDGASIMLEEMEDAGQSGRVRQLLAVRSRDEAEIRKWVSRIGKNVQFTVEDL